MNTALVVSAIAGLLGGVALQRYLATKPQTRNGNGTRKPGGAK